MTEVQSTQRWYVFQTGPNQEFFAERLLNRKRFGTYVPWEMVDKVRMGVTIGRERRALFRSYGFVLINLSTDNWRPITSTYGVKRLFGSAPDKPIPVPEGVVESMQYAALGLTEEHDIVLDVPEAPIAPVLPDSLAEVLEGPLAGRVGLVKSTTRTRAKVLMDILGSQTPVKFKLINLRKYEEPSNGT